MKSTLAGAIAAFAIAAPLAAHAFDDAEKQAIRDEVKAYLMENPEVLIEALQTYEETRTAREAEAAAKMIVERKDDIFDDGYSQVLGNPDGDITMVEFRDYRCGYCKKAQPEVSAFLKSDGNVRFIVKEFPILGEPSTYAARAALAAAKQKDGALYGAYSEKLMGFQGQLSNAKTLEIAGQVGLDVDTLKKDMEGEDITKMIQTTYALARDLDINGTPAFILGDELIPGFVPGSELARIAKAEREKAQN